jgi:hypothetical protein
MTTSRQKSEMDAQYSLKKVAGNPGLEIAGCQWPKASHILEMAGKNKFQQPSKKKMVGEILWIYISSSHLLTTTPIY